jgi:hypothetical protein
MLNTYDGIAAITKIDADYLKALGCKIPITVIPFGIDISDYVMKPVNEEKIPERWRNMCRLNPDTISKQFYSFQKRYVPLPLFIKDSNVRFSDVKIMYYDIQTGILEHNTPKGIIDKYGEHISQPEHPYEIYAVILAEKYPFSKTSITQFLMKGS